MANNAEDSLGKDKNIDPICIRVSDAARLLDISPSKAYELIHRNILPAIRIGASLRVRRVDLDRFIETRAKADELGGDDGGEER
jgi:excisionase family DNA binding protein